MPDYRVEVYDGGRVTRETHAPDWTACLALLRVEAQRFPEKLVAAYRPDRAEADTDGLTDAERDEMLLAVDEARRGITFHAHDPSFNGPRCNAALDAYTLAGRDEDVTCRACRASLHLDHWEVGGE